MSLYTNIKLKKRMSKSDINKLSKRQILESLYYEQSQGNATISRLVTTLARVSKVSPEELAQAFADGSANQEFAQKFNQALKNQPTTETPAEQTSEQ